MYLRPVGDKQLVASALEKVAPTEENMQDLIEIGLHEGVAPALGYGLVLQHYGTCNAITTFEGAVLARPRGDQQACAAALVKHVHAELLANLRADIARQEGREPSEASLAALVADRDWLFGELNYHIDTTHLAATVRFARLLEDPELVRLAHDLTEYGRRLHEQFQFAGEPPFEEVYPAHGLFFAAQLGEKVDEALEYFAKRAKRPTSTKWAPARRKFTWPCWPACNVTTMRCERRSSCFPPACARAGLLPICSSWRGWRAILSH